MGAEKEHSQFISMVISNWPRVEQINEPKTGRPVAWDLCKKF